MPSYSFVFKLVVMRVRLQHTVPWRGHGRVQSSWLARTFSWPRWVYLMVIDLNEVDPRELQKSVRFALDLATAHRIAKGLVIDQERVTAVREALQERLAAAFLEFDIIAMPHRGRGKKRQRLSRSK